jgi:hypothetical protein
LFGTIKANNKDTENDRMIRLASLEAFLDLMVNGSNPPKSLEERSIERLNAFYGSDKNVDLEKGVDDGSIHNR